MRFTTPANLYDIQEILGVSSSSTVYLAHRSNTDLPIKQPLVIKLFKQKKSSIPILQMESLLRARHCSHLVKVLSFEKFQNSPALILEHISGINLKQLIKHSPLSLNETACLCSQVLMGLKELKNNGLAHGDLSLSNILINTTGHVYLTDYGLANYNENNIYSTQPFTAPEFYEEGKACFQSDLFALGVLEKILKGKITLKELQTLESKNFILHKDALLDPYPQNRTPKEFSFSAEALSSIGNKVNQALFIKKCFYSKQKSKKSILNKKYLFNFRLQNIISKKICFSRFLLKPFLNSFFQDFSTSLFKQQKKQFSGYRSICFTITFFIFLLTSNPFISYGKYTPSKLPSDVLVRTQRWIHIDMAGHSGYSPIDIHIPVSGTYKVKWKTQNKRGVKYLYVKAGKRVILRDSDFF